MHVRLKELNNLNEEVIHQVSATLGQVRDLCAHDHYVEIRAEHPNRVKDRLTLRF